ncbi:hypothetical protein LOS78_09420 [Paracoccus sp. MA]|uniref:hypothetical protein n=1 Tax=Paracoccus sp. MA TaxID=2895796 RepID=UPI001E4BAB27|nr:hypothetical protein [Paracoccus sp. MA]UFM66156.1 hypothetical protein LOS78_09420 [Paracoccus sp. MA]
MSSFLSCGVWLQSGSRGIRVAQPAAPANASGDAIFVKPPGLARFFSGGRALPDFAGPRIFRRPPARMAKIWAKPFSQGLRGHAALAPRRAAGAS